MDSFLAAQPERSPAHARFYVVQHTGWASSATMITVLRQVPADAEELGSFDCPNLALEFAEVRAGELRALGVAIELVDPPYGLVGAG